MNLRNRIEDLERATGGTDSLVFYFRTLIEGKPDSDGSPAPIADDVWAASIIYGDRTSVYITKLDEEASDQFRERVSREAARRTAPTQAETPSSHTDHNNQSVAE
ncbi:hypothetical protein SAMN05444149_1082 [Pseudosulfitobacter pseudonitzschiae]|uniref:Uncharacterized protein n=1 Tax=Pseudosulfitobacter pseudonitzschiae TaxID=1402135 RepID=A0A073IXG2_9RHOB|nr:hypothetical protein [Pseudosulfitobacter pseudonitzschiae]KEJ94156.1 hypothetical protein SUH3_07845 [Pseudosulfitobacter pseudonitzschiae]QKS07219.1 hypothetical protein HT745_01320 [Pseudosulfitobacter pseudonitzschiae]SHF98972.1 hypothetical protein SAMN05444149_1082 [Pseudosulfitobacter pseudonitzschiae]